jgi:hypothetical protein
VSDHPTSVRPDVLPVAPAWISSLGGPLIVIPVSALADWTGSTETGRLAGTGEVEDDYDRACAVDELAGVIPVGQEGMQALVLADEPATSCFLPDRLVFVRWLAADSEEELLAAAAAVVAAPSTAWEDCGTWSIDGPAVLFDSAYPGGSQPEQASVPITAGRWLVRSVQTWADESTWVGLVQLLPEQ